MIPADHPCFAGHFPGHPVFPAVAQIDLLQEILEKRLLKNLTILAIHKAKFPAPILPNARVAVAFKGEKNSIFWRIFTQNQIHSMGILTVDHTFS